jgi:hypothetical protein
MRRTLISLSIMSAPSESGHDRGNQLSGFFDTRRRTDWKRQGRKLHNSGFRPSKFESADAELNVSHLAAVTASPATALGIYALSGSLAGAAVFVNLRSQAN